MTHSGSGPQPPLTIRRVFNNSAVLANDAAGQERVLLGKGVGFLKHPADQVTDKLVDRTFLLSSGESTSRYVSLLSDMSEE